MWPVENSEVRLGECRHWGVRLRDWGYRIFEEGKESLSRESCSPKGEGAGKNVLSGGDIRDTIEEGGHSFISNSFCRLFHVEIPSHISVRDSVRKGIEMNQTGGEPCSAYKHETLVCSGAVSSKDSLIHLGHYFEVFLSGKDISF